MPLPSDFTERLTALHGAAGTYWLNDLPRRTGAIEERFQLRRLAPAPSLSYSLILHAETTAGRPVVVKIAPPGADLAAEVHMLRALGAARAVAVVDHWPEEDAVVLEHVLPGHRLGEVATEHRAAESLAALLAPGWPDVHPAAPGGTVAAWVRSLEAYLTGPEGPIDAALVQRAHGLAQDLQQDAVVQRLLHGDLHYDNVLVSDERGLLLIDPKGVIGEPAFDLGYLVTRPYPRGNEAPSLSRTVALRLDVLPAALGQDPARVAAYAFVAAVLSAVWACEDGLPTWTSFVEAAHILRKIRPV